MNTRICRICSELYEKIEKIQQHLGISFIEASKVISNTSNIKIDVKVSGPKLEDFVA